MTTTTTTLASFLLARLDEDERRVDQIPEWYCTESARGDGWGSRGDCELCGAYMFDGTEVSTEDQMWQHYEDVHWRSRVLAEVAAKRAIVELHSQYVDDDNGGDWFEPRCVTCYNHGEHEPLRYPCPTLRTLASVYESHPEFNPAWR